MNETRKNMGKGKRKSRVVYEIQRVDIDPTCFDYTRSAKSAKKYAQVEIKGKKLFSVVKFIESTK